MEADIKFDFTTSFQFLANSIHKNAKEKGFYNTPPSDIERIALMMEELGDAIKAIRAKEMPQDEHCPEYTRLEIKLADTIIRIMDYSVYSNLRIDAAILAKIEANANRPFMHGKKI